MPVSLDRLSLSRMDFVALERDVLQDNIILLDAKTGALLALAGLLLFRCLDRLSGILSGSLFAPHPLVHWRKDVALVILVAAIVSIAATTMAAWLAIRPRIVRVNDYIYWGSKIYLTHAAEFISAIKAADAETIEDDMLRMLHTLAGICRKKHAAFEHAVRATEISLVLVVCSEAFLMIASIWR